MYGSQGAEVAGHSEFNSSLYSHLTSFADTVGKSSLDRLTLPGTYGHTQGNNPTGKAYLSLYHTHTHTHSNMHTYKLTRMHYIHT